MMHNGQVYELNQRIFFSSYQSIDGLALAGVPDTEGFLKILTVDQANIRSPAGNSLLLVVPFRLRRCHLGFLPTETTEESEVCVCYMFRSQ